MASNETSTTDEKADSSGAESNSCPPTTTNKDQTPEKRSADEEGSPSIKRQKTDSTNIGTSDQTRCRGKLGEDNNVESDDEDEDCLEGTVDSSASSSDFDEISTFPTKPQIVIKKNNTEEQHA